MSLVDLVDMDLDKEIVSDLGYTRKELDDAFKLIADGDNWKMPIKALVDLDDLEVCNEASIFFTGSVLEVDYIQGTRVGVSAPGYYNTIGA